MNTSTLSILVVALILSIIASSNAAGTCSAAITITARTGSSWEEGGLFHQIYDITVTNNGTCPITTLFGLYVFPTTAHVSEAWNYNQTTGQIGGFSGFIVAGRTLIGPGFVLAGVGAPSLSHEHTLASCPDTCVGSATAAPTASAPIAPTAAPTATSTARPPTSAPTAHPPTSAPTGVAPTVATAAPTLPACATSIRITARANAAFLINGVASQIYDLEITNTGRTTVDQLDITITTTSSTAIAQDNKWNLVHVAGDRYSVLTYGGLTAGTTYLGAGFVLSGTLPSTATPAVAIFSTTC